MNNYYMREIKKVIEENESSIYPLQIKIMGEKHSSKCLNINPQSMKAIKYLFDNMYSFEL